MVKQSPVTLVDVARRAGVSRTTASSALGASGRGLGSNSSNPHLASRGKVGVLISCGAAVICGASVTLINFFWHIGQTVS